MFTFQAISIMRIRPDFLTGPFVLIVRLLRLLLTLMGALNRKGFDIGRNIEPLGDINFDFKNTGLEQLLDVVRRKKSAVKKEG
jgi:hypothetical protein